MLQVAADIYNSILCLGALLNLIMAYQSLQVELVGIVQWNNRLMNHDVTVHQVHI